MSGPADSAAGPSTGPGTSVKDVERRVASCLSQVSSARGRGVSVRRFEVLIERLVSEVGGSLDACAERAWAEQFPSGSVSRVPVTELGNDDLPALVLSAAGEATLARSLRDIRPGPDIGHEALVFDTGEPATGIPAVDSADWFRAAFRAHGPLYRDVVVASLVVSFLGLVTAIYTMQVYDRVVPTGAFPTLLVLTVGVGLSILLEAAGRQMKTVLVNRSSEEIDRQLSQVFFAKSLSLRMDARPGSVGTLASQIKGHEIVRHYMTASFLFLFADLPLGLIFLAVIWMLSGPLVLVPLTLIPVAILAGLWLRAPIERYTLMGAEEANRRNGLLVETLDGAETLKSVGAEWEMGRRWGDLTRQIATADLRVRFLSYLAVNAGQLLQQLTYVGIVATGAYLVTLGDITLGALIACSILSGRALGALSQFPHLIVQSKQAKTALSGLDQMMTLPGDEASGTVSLVPDTVEGSLRLEGVVFGYDPTLPRLVVPELSIAPGQSVAVLGPSGSGKTTLVRLLSGLYRPGQGRVFLDQHDMSLLPPDYLRERVVYVPQDIRLFSGTLRDNLLLGLPVPPESELMEACEMTGVSGLIAAHPMGLGLPITEGGLGLSAGQRQLVGLTRALLARPSVLLLDEPGASLDSRLERTVMGNIFGARGPGTAVVMVTHKLSLLDHCERALVLDGGRVVLDGPRDQIVSRLSGDAGGTAA